MKEVTTKEDARLVLAHLYRIYSMEGAQITTSLIVRELDDCVRHGDRTSAIHYCQELLDIFHLLESAKLSEL